MYTKPTYFNLAQLVTIYIVFTKMTVTILLCVFLTTSDLSKVQETSLLSRLSLNHENSAN